MLCRKVESITPPTNLGQSCFLGYHLLWLPSVTNMHRSIGGTEEKSSWNAAQLPARPFPVPARFWRIRRGLPKGGRDLVFLQRLWLCCAPAVGNRSLGAPSYSKRPSSFQGSQAEAEDVPCAWILPGLELNWPGQKPTNPIFVNHLQHHPVSPTSLEVESDPVLGVVCAT